MKKSSLAILLGSIVSFNALAASAVFTPIEGIDNIAPSGVSNNGEVIVGNYLWTSAAGLEYFSTPLSDITSSGDIILSAYDGTYIDGIFQNFAWAPHPMMTGEISDDGNVVAGYVSDNYHSGDSAIWSADKGFQDFGSNKFFDLSTNGKYAVGKIDENIAVLANVATGVATNFDTKGTCWYGCGRLGFRGVTSEGMPVGYYTFDNYTYEAAFWEDGIPVKVGGISTINKWSMFNAVSENGSIIVGSSYSNDSDDGSRINEKEAIIWDTVNGVRSLEEILVTKYGVDLNGWILTSATAISSDGYTIAGVGYDAQGRRGPWVVSIGAECSALTW